MAVDKYQRVELLFGEENVEMFKNAKVLVLGVGGVGSFCIDGLYRTGITNLTIVDFDVYDVTNQNRQIGSEKVGMYKVERLKELYPEIEALNIKIDENWVNTFDFEPYDVVVDAIDDFRAKIAVIKKCYKKLVSSAGGAKRMDPTKIQVDSIWKTHGDKFAAKIRYQLRRDGFKHKYPCVFSSESANCVEKGSFVGVTGCFGLTVASVVVQQLLKKAKH